MTLALPEGLGSDPGAGTGPGNHHGSDQPMRCYARANMRHNGQFLINLTGHTVVCIYFGAMTVSITITTVMTHRPWQSSSVPNPTPNPTYDPDPDPDCGPDPNPNYDFDPTCVLSGGEFEQNERVFQ